MTPVELAKKILKIIGKKSPNGFTSAKPLATSRLG